MSEYGARISAAAGDAAALLALTIELAEAVARLKVIETAEQERKRAAADKKYRQRHGTSRDVPGQTGTGGDMEGPPPAGKEKGFICPPQEPPNGAARETPATPQPTTDKPPRLPRLKRPPQEPAPWMGLMAKAWTLGTLPPGSATLLRPVVADLGPEETASRLARYCQRGDTYASVRQFVEKHGLYAATSPAKAPTPDSRPRQLRATEQLLV